MFPVNIQSCLVGRMTAPTNTLFSLMNLHYDDLLHIGETIRCSGQEKIHLLPCVTALIKSPLE